jgi:F-type H+-transporting ATPase subunit delta
MDSDRKAILSILKKLTDKSIELQEQVKEELIGGFILKMDNFQVDQSMKSKIKELKKDFEKNLYIKGF